MLFFINGCWRSSNELHISPRNPIAIVTCWCSVFFSIYLNKSYWNSQDDGVDILNHTQLNYINRRSVIYNSSVGEVQVHSKPKKPIKYIYYGHSKDQLIKLNIRENQWGSYYVDSGNCMIQVYFLTPYLLPIMR